MILRFKVYNNNELTVDYSGIKAKMYLDNQILNLNSSFDSFTTLDNINTTSTNITDENSELFGLTSTIRLESGSFLRLDIPIDLYKESDFKIELFNLSDELLFSNSFKMFGYDLGNNPNLNIENNPPFNIFLIQNSNGEYNPAEYSTEYNLTGTDIVYSNFISYRKPLTNQIWFFDANNSEGDRFYYVLDEIGKRTSIGSTQGFFCAEGSAILEQEVSLSRYEVINCVRVLIPGYPITDSSIQYYDGTSVIENGNLYNKKFLKNNMLLNKAWVPSSEIYLESEKVKGFVKDEQVYSGLFFNSFLIEELNINDTVDYIYDNYKIRYELVNKDGVIEKVRDVNIDFSYGYIYSSTDANNFKFIPDSYGDYIVRSEIKWSYNSENIVKCEQDKIFEATHFFEKIEKDCETVIKNLSFSDITLMASAFNPITKEFDLIDTIILEGCDSHSYSFPTDNIYKIVVIKGEESCEHIHIHTCTIRACIEKEILNRICLDKNELNTEKRYYNANSLIMLSFTFLSMLTKEYGNAYSYTFISTSKIDELFNISQVMKKLRQYCDDCSSNTSKSFISNCDCYD